MGNCSSKRSFPVCMLPSKATLAPPVLTEMYTTSYFSNDIVNSGRTRTNGDFADTVQQAIRAMAVARTRRVEVPPYEPLPACSLPNHILLPQSPSGTLSAGSRRIPRIKLHFVRHAQAEHNLAHRYSPDAWKIFNPTLTTHGRDQCKHLSGTFESMKNITHILCSPLHRTLETCLLSFEPLLERGLEIIAWDGLREFGDGPCNQGDEYIALKEKVKELPINTDLLRKGWHTCEKVKFRTQKPQYIDTIKHELYSFCWAILGGGTWKSLKFKEFAGEGDIEVLIVTHGTLLNMITGSTFHNAEYRTYKFGGQISLNKGGKKYDVVERAESVRKTHLKLAEDPLDHAMIHPSAAFESPSSIRNRSASAHEDTKAEGSTSRYDNENDEEAMY